MAQARIHASGCNRPILKDLVNHVLPLVTKQWYHLGLQLLDSDYTHELDTIKADTKNDTRTCCRKMFSKWLSTDVQASWDKVIEALTIIELKNVACNIKLLLLQGVGMETRSDDERRKKPQSSITKSSYSLSAGGWLGEFMKGRYCNMRLKKRKEEKDPWPPVKTRSYITLALMYQKDLQTREETAQTIFLRTRGDISDIPKKINSQRLTDLRNIFNSQSGSIPNSILIEGHPGIGKTTLVKEICIEWAEGKLLTSDKLVLLLLLRDPNVQKINNVQQLIEHFASSTYKVTQIQSYLEDNHGADITVIIDGFDELSSKLQKESFFIQLIEKAILPEAKVVVTSRPTASACLHGVVDKRIEILGFDQTSRMEYANEALQDDHFKLGKLQKHFQQYPNIDAICYIPLLMSIIVFLCMCQPENLPPTASKMYHSFIIHTICHYLKRTGEIAEDEHINKMDHLPQPVQQILQQLQKVAFDGLVEDKIVFTLDDLPDTCRDDPTCYGLLQSIECYCPCQIGTPTKSFNFLHLGIQEYFAAKYVSTLSEYDVYALLQKSFPVTVVEIEKLPLYTGISINDHNRDSKCVRLSNMWIMYCGITSGHCKSLRRYLGPPTDSYFTFLQNDSHSKSNHVTITTTRQVASNKVTPASDQNTSIAVTISQDILKDQVKVLYLFQCFQEAQDDKLCGILSKSFDSNEIKLGGHKLLPHQVVSLGFFLSRLHRKWKKLNLFNCRVGDQGIKLLHHYFCGDKTNKQEITTIDLSFNDLTGASMSLLICETIDNHYHQLLTQKLFNNNINTCVKDISTATISTNAVKVLCMDSDGLIAQEASAISDIMCCLEELYIRNNKLGDDGAVILSYWLTQTNKLRVLDISDNIITVTGAIAIANGLIFNTSIKILDIMGNSMGQDVAMAFAEVITKNKLIKELNIAKCEISGTGTVAIANSLLHNTSLEVLNMSDNIMDQNGATAIAEVIMNNDMLKKLSLWSDDTTDEESVMTVMKSLEYNNSITVLDLPCTLKDSKIESIYFARYFKDPVKFSSFLQCSQDKDLCKILSKSFNSDEIMLGGRRLLPSQVVYLVYLLSSSHRKWKILNLFNCRIGDQGIGVLHRCLCGDKTHKQAITTIDLTLNKLTGASSLLIGETITHYQPQILRLGCNKITSLRDMSSAVIITNTLKVLFLDSNGLKAQEASALSDIMCCLEELYICNNDLGDDGAVILSGGITQTSKLRVLDIGDNKITTTGTMTIANSLTYNTSIELLDIMGNAIGQDGATAIAEAITENRTIKELNIARCKILGTGAIAVANSLWHNTSLEILNMNHITIDQDGATAIAEAIMNNDTLKKLSLWNDDTIDEELAMIIMKSLYYNNSITILDLPCKLQHNDRVKREFENINYTRLMVQKEELTVDW
ncbi:protein NLRC3-like isoform X2 [Dysidea avara]|uniref:protein NLRC3-like isoform X2 n=1 Tax=Dysidea avara TaxID=196820 RepID=UPI00332A982F